MTLNRVSLVSCALIAALAGVAHAQVGGIARPEEGGPIDGTAQAGQAAIALDAQTAWLNPAGLVLIGEKTDIIVAGNFTNTQFSFSPVPQSTTPGNDGGDAGGWDFGGSLYISHQLNETWALGFSITRPYGYSNKYDTGWTGRYFVDESRLSTINLEPSVGIKINDVWSIGGGLDIQYADFNQKTSVNDPGNPDGWAQLEGNSWALGFSAGAIMRVSDKLRFGGRYRSQVSHTLGSGPSTSSPAISAATTKAITLPHSATLSAYYDINDEFAIMGDLAWSNWNSFDRTIINAEFDGGTGSTSIIPRNYKDTWGGAIGLHWKPIDRWIFKFGFSFASDAVGSDNRLPDIPSDSQYRIAAGFEHDVSENFRIGLNYTRVDLNDNLVAETINATSGSLAGTYETATQHILGVYAAWTF